MEFADSNFSLNETQGILLIMNSCVINLNVIIYFESVRK